MLSDDVILHLKTVADLPDFSGTRYRIVRPLGRGGFGTVYLAQDEKLDREVAVKVLSIPDPSGDFAARLLGEARLLARLEHPNVVPIHDAGTLADGRVYYVMTYVRGKRLDAWRRANPSRPVLLRLFQKICDAVDFAHARGIVHRDLKPENVMVGPFGEALVLDWGVALARDGATRGGEPVVAGTPAWMAPEQARGDVAAIDERADVYALGAILSYLLSGRPPIQAPEDGEAPRAGARGEGPAHGADVPGVPRALQAICVMATARDPGGRYATARELSEDIDRFLDRLPVRAHRESPFERIGRFLDRNRVVVCLILAYLLMRAVILVLTGR